MLKMIHFNNIYIYIQITLCDIVQYNARSYKKSRGQQAERPKSQGNQEANKPYKTRTLQEVKWPRSPEPEKPRSQGNQETIQEQKAIIILQATRLQEVERPRSPETEKPRSQGNQEVIQEQKAIIVLQATRLQEVVGTCLNR